MTKNVKLNGLEDLLHNAQMSPQALDVAYTLCPDDIDLDDESAWRGVLLSANFALKIGLQQIKTDKIKDGGQQYLDRLIKRLLIILRRGLLTARERADAGLVLGKLGDPRPGVCSLPPVWIELPGGRFIMGDEQYGPPHEVELSPFKISKYPITHAQFAEFVDAKGYNTKNWWSEEGWKYRQEEGWEQPRRWDNDDFNLPNQPVVGVSWFETKAFCAWLSKQGGMEQGAKQGSREQGAKENGLIVRLPTEAEWEYAARGQVGRKYPWGESDPTVEHANYDASRINHTTAVGCYPKGATPEGILDLAGNVWEWCWDWFGGKYYAECKKRGIVKDPRGPDSGTLRAVRGGSWFDSQVDLHAVFRDGDLPVVRSKGWGFRVVLSARSCSKVVYLQD